MTKLERLARKGDALLDAHQRARLEELNGIERLIFTKLTIQLAQMLEETNGRITSRFGFVSISKAIDEIFDAIQARQLGRMTQNIAGDMRSVMDFNAAYYRVAAGRGTDLEAVNKAVEARLRKRLGIDVKGGVMNRGYLDGLFPTEASRNEVKALVQKSIAGGIPQKQLTKALATMITGTTQSAGVLEKNIGGAVMGAYRLADSVTNNEFGERLGMKHGIYSGGLIETSRAFCIAKNGKVFTVEEAQRDWPVDPLLPRTTAEREAYGPSGAPPSYVPLEDLGRWEGKSERCRHRFLYISDEEAKRRLAEQNKPKPTEPEPPPSVRAVEKEVDKAKDDIQESLRAMEPGLEPDDYKRARSIIEPHPAREKSKLSSLVKSMEADGWVGRPVLVWKDESGGLFSITGSHRIAAARLADIEVPVRYVDADLFAQQLEKDGLSPEDLIGSGDENLADFFLRAGDMESAALMFQEVRLNP